jgi:toxin ParE1/3/4
VDLADRFLEAAEATLEMLARHTESGIRTDCGRSELAGMRRFPVGDGFEKILVFYIPCADGIDLIRVVHGARDLASLFAP